MKNRVREWREKRGLSQVQLAELAGTSGPQVQRLERGDRKLTIEWAERLARALNVRAMDLVFSLEEIEDALKHAPATLPTRSVEVIGAAQAGAWSDALAWPESDRYEVAGVYDGYEKKTLYGLEVRGSSMNKPLPEGSVVICVPFLEWEGDMDGRIVHVETRRGGEVEATLKRFRRNKNGDAWLWPESDDPEHQAPIKLDAAEFDDATEVQIAGVAISRNSPL